MWLISAWRGRGKRQGLLEWLSTKKTSRKTLTVTHSTSPGRCLPSIGTAAPADPAPAAAVTGCGPGRWCDLADALLGLEDMHVLSVDRSRADRITVVVETGDTAGWCPGCGAAAKAHNRRTVTAHDAPLLGFPLVLRWRKRIYRCRERQCARSTFSEEHWLIGPREKLTVRAVRWAVDSLKHHDTSVSAIARQLGVAWQTAWDAIQALAGTELNDPARLHGIGSLGVDEHVWKHTGFPSERMVTGMVDHTRGRNGKPRARLLDLVPGRSGSVYKEWLESQGQGFIAGISTATLDPFRGYANAIDDCLPEAVTVLDAFHVVKLGTSMLDDIRRRVQNATLGHRGRKNDPLFRIRRTLLQGAEHLTDKQLAALNTRLEAGDPESEVTIGWHCYQELRLIYHVRHHDGKRTLQKLLDKYASCPIPEIKRLIGTLNRWKTEISAYFDTGGATNGPTEAINGVIETTRRIARGFRNFTNYRIRSLLAAGGYRPYRT